MMEILANFSAALPLAAGGLTTAYIICLIVGGGLLVLSTFFGGDADSDVDVGVDGDSDINVDGDAHAGHADAVSLSSWFSTRFLVYAAAGFGLIGTALTYTTGLLPMVVLTCAVIGGIVIGQGAHQVMRSLNKSSGNSQVAREDYLNQPGRVTIAIDPNQRGEVALHVKGRERFIPAASRRDDDKFDVGSSVVVVGLNNGTAEVVSRKEYDFLNESK